MNTELKLSTKFLTSQDAHQVGMLVTVGSEAPVEAAKEAAIAFTRFLSDRDRLSVVAFDDQVFPMWGPRAA